MSTSRIAIVRALVSVHDKTGLAGLAAALHEAGVELVSTGGTAAAIQAGGIPVTSVDELTGVPEILDGRVKTLHPAVHAGLLADPGAADHAEQLDRLGISRFQLLVSNLYPFGAAAGSGADPAHCIEQIDIGGPAMIRAAAKNHAHVAVVTSPADYDQITAALGAGGFTMEQRRRLAARAFAHTAGYDAAIASWFAADYAPDESARATGWPDLAFAAYRRREVLRYGENPHQHGALYLPVTVPVTAPQAMAGPGTAADVPGRASADSGVAGHGVALARQLHGRAMSYNNYLDADTAWRLANDFGEPCVCIVKHCNPCGIAVAANIADAHRKASDCDPVSAYGSVVAANREVTDELAAQVAGIFTEVLIAPGFSAVALDLLGTRKNLRLLHCGAAGRADPVQWRQIGGGLLMQTPDMLAEPGDDPANWLLAAGPAADGDTLADLVFAWRACRGVRSNAILIASGQAAIGIGMGQVNRVDAARLATARAGGRAAGAVAASDAFFPFADGLEVLIEAGVRAVVQPGGSMRDDAVTDTAAAAGITLYLTGVRHFSH